MRHPDRRGLAEILGNSCYGEYNPVAMLLHILHNHPGDIKPGAMNLAEY